MLLEHGRSCGPVQIGTPNLDGAGFACEVCSDVLPNPPTENVQAGVTAFEASGADVLVAVGGGSPQDARKAIREVLRGGTAMPRYCFQLQVRPERLDEYRERHRAVWPEMLAALRDTGWRNYSLFARDDGLLIGYVEADDLRAAQAGMAATEVNARWQAEMAPFFVDLEGRPDEGFLLLEEVFHLEDQLADGASPEVG